MPPKPGRAITLKQKCDLITAVRSEKSLYDPKNANSKPKHGVWSRVASQCGIKRGLVAKLIWKRIHQAYTAHLENPEQDQGINETNSILFKRMKFMDPYLQKHPTNETKSSIPNSDKKTEVKFELKEDTLDENHSNLNETTTNGEFTTIQFWNDTENNSKTASETRPQTGNSHFDDLGSDTESYEDIILPDAVNNGTTENSLKMFFDAMFASTSQMPQVLQRTVKRKIFAIVLEAEEEAETQK